MKIFFVFIVTLVAASASAEDDGTATSLTSGNALTKILENVGDASSDAVSNANKALENLQTTISELFSDLEDGNVVVSSLASSAINILNTVTEKLQNVVETASNTATGALETVKTEVNSFIGTVSKNGDDLIKEIADAANVDLEEGVASCVNSAKNEGIATVQNLISDSIDCPIEIIESIASKLSELIVTPASAVNLAETAVEDLTACKASNSIISRVACVGKASATIQLKAAALVAKTAFLVVETSGEVTTVRETLILCVTSNLAPSAWSVATIVAKMGACSVTSVFSG